MIDSALITEHMEVVGSDGKHVGRVDHVKGGEIELAKLDLQTLGTHRMIPLSWVEYIDDKVHLSMDREEAEDNWLKKN